MSIVKDSLWASSSAVLIAGSRFALIALLARHLSVENLGVVVYVQWLIDISFLAVGFGVPAIASRYFAEYRNKPSMLGAIFSRWRPFSFALPILSSFVTVFFIWVSEISVMSVELYLLVFAWSAANGVFNMHAAALTGLQRFDLLFLTSLILASPIIVMASFEVIDITSVFRYVAIAAILSSIVGVNKISKLATKRTIKIDSKTNRTIYTYALNIWLTMLMWNLMWSRGEVPFIRMFYGDIGIAKYSVALTLFGGAVMCVMLAVSAVAPEITRLLGEGNRKSAIQVCRNSMDLQLFLSGFGALLLILFSPELIYFFFGEGYSESATLLSILAMGLPAMAVTAHNHFLQIITGATYNRNTTFLGVVLFLPLAWICARNFGLESVALSRGLAMLALSGVTVWVCWSHWKSKAVSLSNLSTIIFLLVFSSILMNFYFYIFESIALRFSIFIGFIAVMGFLLRTEKGGLYFVHIANFMLEYRWRKPTVGGK